MSKNKKQQDDGIEIEQINYRMPRVLYDEAKKRCKGGMSIQNLITLTLAMAWHVPPPEVRPKGRPRKAKQ